MAERVFSVREPSKGRNRALYQVAIDECIAYANGQWGRMNPYWYERTFITVRYYSRKSGYMVRLCHGTDYGATQSVHLVFSK